MNYASGENDITQEGGFSKASMLGDELDRDRIFIFRLFSGQIINNLKYFNYG